MENENREYIDSGILEMYVYGLLTEKENEDGRRRQQQFDSVLKAVNGLALGDKYQSRQLWADLCLVLLKNLPREMFEKYFIDGYLLSVMDNVSNVRIAAANVLCSWGPEYKAPWDDHDDDEHTTDGLSVDDKNGDIYRHEQCPWIWFLQRDDIKECIQRLRRDHHDIIICLGRILPLYPDLQLEALSCRGLQDPPGGTEPIMNCETGGACTDSFRRLYGMDDRESTASEVSSVGTEPVDLEAATKRLSGKQDLASLQMTLSTSTQDQLLASPDDDEVGIMTGSPTARSNSPTLEEALEIEEKLFFDANSVDRTAQLEKEENLSSDPEFLPVQDRDDDMPPMPPSDA